MSESPHALDSLRALAADLRRYLIQLQALGVDGIIISTEARAPVAQVTTVPTPSRPAPTTPISPSTPTPAEMPQPPVRPPQVITMPNDPQAPGSPPVLSGVAAEKQHRLNTLTSRYARCQDCKLGRTRTHLVYGVGNPDADLMFVGEGPGADEDATGVPFVGKAGQLLTRIIAATGLTRRDVYICNIVKCRPPGNRDPEPDEIDACFPKLAEQIEIVQPRVICAVGRPAAHTLLGTTAPISALRGKWFDYNGIPVMPIFHPSYLLRDPPGAKRLTWQDVQEIMKRLGLPGQT